jgi:hypothetical protein
MQKATKSMKSDNHIVFRKTPKQKIRLNLLGWGGGGKEKEEEEGGGFYN